MVGLLKQHGWLIERSAFFLSFPFGNRNLIHGPDKKQREELSHSFESKEEMDTIGKKSGMLMTKGLMTFRNDPPSLACAIRTYRNSQNGKTVVLHPIPNMAVRTYFDRVLHDVHKSGSFDKILCEDGRLPFVEGTFEANKVKFYRKLLPFFGHRPVAPADCELFDGLLHRDPVESRMSHASVVEALTPSVDPRARRGVERIESYPDNVRVAVPWNVYHLVYFSEKLPQLGYELVNTEEVVVIGQRQAFAVALGLGMFSVLMVMSLFRLLFGI